MDDACVDGFPVDEISAGSIGDEGVADDVASKAMAADGGSSAASRRLLTDGLLGGAGRAPSVKTPRRLCRFTATTSDWKARGIELFKLNSHDLRPDAVQTNERLRSLSLTFSSEARLRGARTKPRSRRHGRGRIHSRGAPRRLPARLPYRARQVGVADARAATCARATAGERLRAKGWHRQHRDRPSEESAAGDLVEEPHKVCGRVGVRRRHLYERPRAAARRTRKNAAEAHGQPTKGWQRRVADGEAAHLRKAA